MAELAERVGPELHLGKSRMHDGPSGLVERNGAELVREQSVALVEEAGGQGGFSQRRRTCKDDGFSTRDDCGAVQRHHSALMNERSERGAQEKEPDLVLGTSSGSLNRDARAVFYEVAGDAVDVQQQRVGARHEADSCR